MESRVCPVCAGVFIPRQLLEKYCSDGCRRQARLRREAAYRERRRALLREADKRLPAQPMEEIRRFDRLACEAGLSYGKYVQRMRKEEGEKGEES